MRRYEILLPRRLDDGSPVTAGMVSPVLAALREALRGGFRRAAQHICGEWEHEGQVYRDELLRVFVDVPDTGENREWFRGFKERLKRDFQQLDIWITTHPIEVL